ncbi:MAG: hypothetical protein ACK5DV_14620, partial [Planctomycetota bacterium]
MYTPTRRRTWFSSLHNWFTRPAKALVRKSIRRMLQIDTLEERITPVASLTFLNLNPALGNFNPTNMAVLGTNVIFAADNGTGGVELWKNASTATVTSAS